MDTSACTIVRDDISEDVSMSSDFEDSDDDVMDISDCDTDSEDKMVYEDTEDSEDSESDSDDEEECTEVDSDAETVVIERLDKENIPPRGTPRRPVLPPYRRWRPEDVLKDSTRFNY